MLVILMAIGLLYPKLGQTQELTVNNDKINKAYALVEKLKEKQPNKAEQLRLCTRYYQQYSYEYLQSQNAHNVEKMVFLSMDFLQPARSYYEGLIQDSYAHQVIQPMTHDVIRFVYSVVLNKEIHGRALNSPSLRTMALTILSETLQLEEHVFVDREVNSVKPNVLRASLKKIVESHRNIKAGRRFFK